MMELYPVGLPLGPNVFQQVPVHGLSGWIEQHYEILPELQDILLPIIRNVLIFLTAIFIILLLTYLVSIYQHRQRSLYITSKKNQWQDVLQSSLCGELSPGDIVLPRRDRKYFRDILITEFPNLDIAGRNSIRDLYQKLGFVNEDTRQLKSRLWWRRTQALDRLADLGLGEAEEHVLPLLKDKRVEVRLSAVKMLAAIGSIALAEQLPEIFASNTRWAYRYLVNKLFLAEIPVATIIPLVSSGDRDLRKGGAILLGKEGNNEAIPLLQELVNDSVKDVRREAVRSLGRIKSVEAIPVLANKIKDDNPQVRAETARALGELQDTGTLSLLEKLADDLEYSVRFQAFFALDRFGPPGESIIRKYQVKYPEISGEFLAKHKNHDHRN